MDSDLQKVIEDGRQYGSGPKNWLLQIEILLIMDISAFEVFLQVT